MGRSISKVPSNRVPPRLCQTNGGLVPDSRGKAAGVENLSGCLIGWALLAGALHSMLHGAWLGAEWSREGLPRRVRYLVLDEADLLLSGGFADATGRLLEVHASHKRFCFVCNVLRGVRRCCLPTSELLLPPRLLRECQITCPGQIEHA